MVYKGHWKNDQPHGEGVYFFKNGDVYQGNHDDGDYHGVGKFISHCGTVYHGEWSRGRRSGKANYFDMGSGIITRGVWKDDVFIEYLEHKIASEPKNGIEPKPLQVGFDWTKYSGIIPHVHGPTGCDHSHHQSHHEASHRDY